MPVHDLSGKGMYLWNLRAVGGAKPAELVKRLKSAGLKHVYVKIANGRSKFPRAGADHTHAVIQEAQAQGLVAWGWHYVYGESPKAEAEMAVELAVKYAVTGYIYNAEKEYRDKKRVKEAEIFLAALRQGLPSMPLGFSSFKYPKNHPGFPWKEMIGAADVLMPQVYWELRHDPAAQLTTSVAGWSEYKENPVIVPTGAAYSDTKKWKPTAADVTAFLTAAVAANHPAADFWSWDSIVRKDYANLLEAVTNFSWPA